VAISLRCEVCPEIREYERTSTTIANAYVLPRMAGYLGELEPTCARKAFPAPCC
jgi:N-methylhydantoinase A